jgi:hypothetical protein
MVVLINNLGRITLDTPQVYFAITIYFYQSMPYTLKTSGKGIIDNNINPTFRSFLSLAKMETVALRLLRPFGYQRHPRSLRDRIRNLGRIVYQNAQP